MCTEIEAKLKVESLEEIKHRLTKLGAEFLQEQLQTDYHFDDANMTLQKTDRCLRLRRQLADGGERFFLTFKGAKEESSFKKRQEIEIEITDSSSIQKLLLALGYKKVLIFLGQAGDGYEISSDIAYCLLSGIKLSLTAINEDEVRDDCPVIFGSGVSTTFESSL